MSAKLNRTTLDYHLPIIFEICIIRLKKNVKLCVNLKYSSLNNISYMLLHLKV